MDYNYDVEEFLLRVIYHNLYNSGAFVQYCKPYADCTDCIKCPMSGYRGYAKIVRALCTKFIVMLAF